MFSDSTVNDAYLFICVIIHLKTENLEKYKEIYDKEPSMKLKGSGGPF